MALKYKVGDKVRIKSLDWYNENKNTQGNILFDNAVFTGKQSLYCECELTIRLVTDDSYYVIENDYYWTDEMIEGLADDIEITQDAKTFSAGYDQGYEDGQYDMNEWILPKGFEFHDENGNVINATKIVLEKKKKEYPRTYKECCKVLGVSEFEYNHTGTNVWYKHKLMATLDELILCRNAYWKLYGEEMGLGKPWEPDWKHGKDKFYCISTTEGEIVLGEWYIDNKILTFPLKEMRDAFYENFKDLIESVKELL